MRLHAVYAMHITKSVAHDQSCMVQVPSLIFIQLSGNRLQGTLPAAFATALPALLGLFLADNALTGTLPAQWAALPNLSLLDLRNNKLAGTLPPAWGAWPNIRGLRLASNQLSSTLPADYGSWDSIQELKLGAPQVLLDCTPLRAQLDHSPFISSCMQASVHSHIHLLSQYTSSRGVMSVSHLTSCLGGNNSLALCIANRTLCSRAHASPPSCHLLPCQPFTPSTIVWLPTVSDLT